VKWSQVSFAVAGKFLHHCLASEPDFKCSSNARSRSASVTSSSGET
jgi:hypothetical protein